MFLVANRDDLDAGLIVNFIEHPKVTGPKFPRGEWMPNHLLATLALNIRIRN